MLSTIQKSLQKLINHYLALDPESGARIKTLENKIISVELLGVDIVFQIKFQDSKVLLKDSFEEPANTFIKGTPFSLLRMTLTTSDRKHFFKDDVVIEGDIECGQEVIDLFDSLEIDWEEYASRLIGDPLAQKGGYATKKILGFGQTIKDSLTQQIDEYIHEEINLVPPQEELQDFFSGVDTLRMDTDRLEARILKLMTLTNTKKED